MAFSYASMARQVAMMETQESIENTKDQKLIARAMHKIAQGELKLRDLEKWQAYKIQNVKNTINVVKSAVNVVNKAKDLKAKVDTAADEAGASKSGQTDEAGAGRKQSESRPAAGEQAAKKAGGDEEKDAMREKVLDEIKSHLESAMMERLDWKEKKAHERAGRHEELAGKFRAVGKQVREHAYEHEAKVREIEKETFDQARGEKDSK